MFSPPSRTISSIMHQVIYALFPGVLLHIYFFGWGIVWHLLLASLLATGIEICASLLRNRQWNEFREDGSALVTAWLLVLAIPPLAPWWVTITGIAFALIFTRHLYGGLGYNLFNPAMAGYALLLVAFPLEMTRWPILNEVDEYYRLGLLDSFGQIFFGMMPSTLSLDGISGATPLDKMKTDLGLFKTVSEINSDTLFGNFGAKGWEWIGAAFLIGGVWLIYQRIITWHIPVGVLAGVFFSALIFWGIDSDSFPSPVYHLVTGATILCAFFIATDPVSAATSPTGRIYFGIGIGVLVYVIRTWGGYPDGVAFGVLLLNLCVPLIDRYTAPKTFGYELKSAVEAEDHRP